MLGLAGAGASFAVGSLTAACLDRLHAVLRTRWDLLAAVTECDYLAACTCGIVALSAVELWLLRRLCGGGGAWKRSRLACAITSAALGFASLSSLLYWRHATLSYDTGAHSLVDPHILRPLAAFLSSAGVFHFGEYAAMAYIGERDLGWDSFVLNHSREYGIAMAAALFEYVILAVYWPATKQHTVAVSLLGLSMCLCGDVVRKCAMLTAGRGFTHQVQRVRRSGHELVTGGVYALCRHPSYAGWFVWAVGTQVALCNPVCTLLYALAAWKFFDERVKDEELYLLQFFGSKYVKYKRDVPFSGVPFVNGIDLSHWDHTLDLGVDW